MTSQKRSGHQGLIELNSPANYHAQAFHRCGDYEGKGESMKPGQFLVLLLLGFVVLHVGCTKPPPPKQQLLKLHLDALNLISQHKFGEAEKVLLKLVEFAPSAFVPRYNLAVSQLNQAEKGTDRALETLKTAAVLKPGEARVHYNLGIIRRFNGEEAIALHQFQQALKLAPRDADCHYQVAIGLVRAEKNEQALPHFEMAVQLDPTIRGAWNNLQLSWRRIGQIEDANRALANFRALEATGRGRAHSTKYTEQGKLAEAVRDWLLSDSSSGQKLPNDVPELIRITDATPGGAPPFALVDADLDCIPDLWIAGDEPGAWSLSEDPEKIAPIDRLKDAICFAVADVDEDGLPDLAISNGDEVQILKGEGGRTPKYGTLISSVTARATDLLLADIDMEGDLDLLMASGTGPVQLSLNEGHKFRAVSDSPDLSGTQPVGRIIAVRDLDRDLDADLLLAGDRLSWISGAPQWKFQEDPAQRPLISEVGIEASSVILVDLVGDLEQELVLLQHGKLKILRSSSTHQDAEGMALFDGEVDLPMQVKSASYVTLAAQDLDLDGTEELLLATSEKTHVLQFIDGVPTLMTRTYPAATTLVSGDVDGDGDLDLILEKADGSLWLMRNDLELAAPPLHTFRAHLGGRRDGDDRRTNLLGFGARLELRGPNQPVLAFQEGKGGHHARGLLPVVVGLNRAERLDSLIIEWPDGVLQAETNPLVDRCQEIEETQRKSSSCPILFTFDGQKWNFITDFMGGGGLGFWIGPDQFAPPEPTEVVRISPEALKPVGKRLRLSIMEPMQEICYADRLALIAVDHPQTHSCYPEEFFPIQAAPPSGKPLLIEDQGRIFPSVVRDANGAVDAALVTEIDRLYAGPRGLIPDMVGYCENQVWEFNFESTPEGSSIALLLDGWIEYPYSRINFAAWQGGQRLSAPTFHWRSSSDQPWQLLAEELGYPAGMPKTMVLDVSDIIARGARQIRIESNLELYWDRVSLASVHPPAAEQIHSIPLHSAILRDGGYPRESSDDGNLPATYHYDQRDPTLDYRPMENGYVTRYGRVDSLLAEADDRFVIIGGGDELILEYDASALPELHPGWKRTWLLDTFGWCKDLDPLTGARQGVGPLPFQGMSQYPPHDEEPTPDRSNYQANWNTRRD
ncbi:MAG: ASPIC/UnbV domain-containing protein [Planctomycetota bacterium]|nr:ASPIC/UnbV domain-containing protein [Planctomycetota bacterium]